jgi:hypothetical protein
LQALAGPVMTAAGLASTLMAWESFPVQPPAPVTVTLYVPLVVTVMVCVVSPVDQR